MKYYYSQYRACNDPQIINFILRKVGSFYYKIRKFDEIETFRYPIARTHVFSI